ncbi:hypothetical protein ACWCOV_12245 [Kribbella sp. NPDC002412]
MKTHDIDAAVRGLAPARTEDRVTDAAWDQVAENVTSEHAPAVGLEPRRRPARRPRLVLAAAASLLIAGVVAATLVNQPGQYQPRALSFTEQGDKLIVRVVDPTADPKRYNAEFKKMGLDITVRAVPVSPPSVGDIISFSARNEHDMDQLRRLEPGEKCPGTLNASDPGCQAGLELPKNYDGTTVIDFGRAAKPGELYQHTSSSATAKGEMLAGLAIDNKTVAQVLPQIEARGVKVVAYLSGKAPNLDSNTTAPGNWYVHGAMSHAPGEVVLFVDAKPEK